MYVGKARKPFGQSFVSKTKRHKRYIKEQSENLDDVFEDTNGFLAKYEKSLIDTLYGALETYLNSNKVAFNEAVYLYENAVYEEAMDFFVGNSTEADFEDEETFDRKFSDWFEYEYHYFNLFVKDLLNNPISVFKDSSFDAFVEVFLGENYCNIDVCLGFPTIHARDMMNEGFVTAVFSEFYYNTAKQWDAIVEKAFAGIAKKIINDYGVTVKCGFYGDCKGGPKRLTGTTSDIFNTKDECLLEADIEFYK